MPLSDSHTIIFLIFQAETRAKCLADANNITYVTDPQRKDTMRNWMERQCEGRGGLQRCFACKKKDHNDDDALGVQYLSSFLLRRDVGLLHGP